MFRIIVKEAQRKRVFVEYIYICIYIDLFIDLYIDLFIDLVRQTDRQTGACIVHCSRFFDTFRALPWHLQKQKNLATNFQQFWLNDSV